MSFFKDDFYSTKVSRQAVKGWKGSSRDQQKWIRVALLSALGGVVVTLLLLPLFNNGSYWDRGISTGGSVRTTAAGQSFDWNDRVVQAGEKVRPAVVSVISKEVDKDMVKSLGLGSGIIFQKNGDKVRVVTNNHVVESGSSFEVILATNERKKATIVGRDTITDLAVLEIDGAGIKSIAEFGDSDRLKPGETAIAIGNPLGLGFSQTTTVGVISSPLRTIPVSLGKDGELDWEMEVIQTDAAINQGNSGGALISLEGKVVGINSLKIADTGVEGLGFAIPINRVKPILDMLIRDHKVKRPYLGVVTQDLQSFKRGLDVLKLPEQVKMGAIVMDTTGPAKEAGMKTNDVIVELDGKAISGTMALRKYLYNNKKIGEKTNVTYYRGGKKVSLAITLAELNDK